MPEVLLSWSPYCEAYAVSPWLTTVYRWDGTRYLEATQAFPDVLAADWEGVLLAEPYAEDWTARGRACLAGAYGFLAYEGGDVESAAAECARAREIDPEWWADWAATFCP